MAPRNLLKVQRHEEVEGVCFSSRSGVRTPEETQLLFSEFPILPLQKSTQKFVGKIFSDFIKTSKATTFCIYFTYENSCSALWSLPCAPWRPKKRKMSWRWCSLPLMPLIGTRITGTHISRHPKSENGILHELFARIPSDCVFLGEDSSRDLPTSAVYSAGASGAPITPIVVGNHIRVCIFLCLLLLLNQRIGVQGRLHPMQLQISV